MQHIAILKEPYLQKILSGEKTIESRWSQTKLPPYGKVKDGDTIYLKKASGNVVAKCMVQKVASFENLNENKIKEILQKYHKQICVEPQQFDMFKNKNYCTLMWISDIKHLTPFKIDKQGFGMMSAWISLPKEKPMASMKIKED